MRVGLVTYDFYPPVGGQGVEAYQLYRELRDRPGVEVSVLSSRDNQLDGHTRVPVLDNERLGPFHFSFKVWRFLDRYAEELKLDLLQVYGAVGGVFLFRKPAVPLVYLANQTYAQQQQYLKKKYYRPLAWIERKGFTFAERIASISTTTRDSLVHDYHIPGDKIEVIPVGVDRETFKPLALERIGGSLLFVGRLCPRKGLDHLIEAVGIVKREFPGIKLYVVGEGSLRCELERQVVLSGLDSNVFFLGRVSDDELVKWYNMVEVFVLPALFEGFGIVCLEAMACGTPVITTRVPGVVDIISDKPPNRLVPPEDPASLARAILEFFNQRKSRGPAGEHSREDDLERFDWSSICGSFMELYRTVLENDRG